MSNVSSYSLSVFGGAGYTILGFPTSVCNFLITASILKYSALRDQKEIIILMGLACSDAVNSLGFGLAGFYRLVMVFSDRADSPVSISHCLSLPHMWCWAIGGPWSAVMLVIVSADRFLLVALREKYIFNLGQRYGWCMVMVPSCICTLFALVALFVALVFSDDTPLLNAMCHSPDGYNSGTIIGYIFAQFYEQTSSKLTFVSVLLFIAVYPVYRHQQAKVSPNSDEQLKIQMKRQQRLTKNIAVSSFCTLIFACIPTELGYMFWYDYELYLIGYFCWILILMNPLANLFIYQLGNKDMRIAIRGLIVCKEMPESIDLWHVNH